MFLFSYLQNFFFQKAQNSLKNVTEEESNIRFAYVTARDVKALVGKNHFIVRPQSGANFEYGTSEKVRSQNLSEIFFEL